MKSILHAAATLGALVWSAGAGAQVVWQCEVLHSYDLGDKGAFERFSNNVYVGDRFTANDDTGEVAGSAHLGDPKDWKKVPRRFGPDQDGLQTVRGSGGRQYMHLYVQTFSAGPVKPFVIFELDIGATRTGTCRARP